MAADRGDIKRAFSGTEEMLPGFHNLAVETYENKYCERSDDCNHLWECSWLQKITDGKCPSFLYFPFIEKDTFRTKMLKFVKSASGKKITPQAELAGFLCLIFALGIFCVQATKIVTPKRKDYGATWGMYLQEEPDSADVMFFGSSLVYCGIIPAILYEESHTASYIMAGPSQNLSFTYYYLHEACKTQSPATVFVECTGLVYSPPSNNLKANLGFMPLGLNRLLPTLEFAPDDQRTGLLFPLYAYHDRWDKLVPADWDDYAPDPLAGYTFLSTVKPVEEVALRFISEEVFTCPDYYDLNLDYLQRIHQYCQEHGIRPVYFFMPNTRPLPPNVKDRIRQDVEGFGGELVDFAEDWAVYGPDLDCDFYDELHFNCFGAEKFSHYLGGRLDLWVDSQIPSDPTLWQERSKYFAVLQAEAREQLLLDRDLDQTE